MPIYQLALPRSVLPRCRAVRYSRLLHSARCYSQDSQPKPGNTILQQLRKKLEPFCNSTKDKLEQTCAQVRYSSMQLRYHLEKARASVQEANKKLVQQEREGENSMLTFNDDLENKSKIVDLPSERERKRRQWSRKLEFYIDSLQETIFTATKALNDVTGYSSIEKLRKSIDMMETQLQETKRKLMQLREAHSDAVAVRNQSQRQVNELLQRKHMWSPGDLESFTRLYKEDADNVRRQEEANASLKAMEAKEEELSNSLHRAILTRYHEEQIWSDKIRRTSTWGTFILMGLNILLFLVVQLLLEPWKRRRLTNSFEDKVKRALEDHSLQHNLVLDRLSDRISEKIDAEMVHGIAPVPLPERTEQPEQPPAATTSGQPLGLREALASVGAAIAAEFGFFQAWIADHVRAIGGPTLSALQGFSGWPVLHIDLYNTVIFTCGMLLGLLVSH
ncbi:AFR393Wp [Eremothecium gossypii ATCC 10895]|uniref:Sensitive to high expression protein 9 homolog, mitochondrial n=1 Tax=Eremothecium gossypii (strain ATCC 10895 / CBS 109.51 / FGSC 9923 / NRRL Y-1056) TaxID=284811 RepID=SHE9_EREGS|nr:AFR393Wp [Eremothecium gossypii ATCC 10895]Q753C3.1 RecName: Full=Sensitive to high expression protein 9 homolog, mitochondrial; Flags: Precursor [Eremothecium gossypii ATCC 10895]AAS53764.1 AFR393Wp [Eremothecium gossypii ATCC 10895]